MPLSAFRRQPAPAAAAAWFSGRAGNVVVASEAELLRAAARERPGQTALFLQPGVVEWAERDSLEAQP
ncbi:MAG: hypothetical protein M3Q51_06045, partial [Pseudomonadota bacterium]|nr:hypothetical protein [Pseudomonadota bacterium]